MSETQRIAEQLRAMVDGDPWHGPPLTKLLDGITAAQASAKPVAGAHSIRELLLHFASWQDITRRRLGGEDVKITPALNWPPADDPGEDAWRRDVAAALSGARALADTIAALPEARLSARVIDAPDAPTFYAVLHGILQHDGWHGGQIALLRRAAGNPLGS